MFANLSIFYYDIINKFDLNINKIITSEMPYKNYQEHLANCAEYRANNKETVKMSYIISKWIARGLIETDQYTYEELYIAYLCCDECELCGVTLTTDKRCSTTKCMDHDHKTGVFRNIVCLTCNNKLR
jgi:hypothetical protein